MGKKANQQAEEKLGRKAYEAALAPMQLELAQMSRWLAHHQSWSPEVGLP